LFCVDIKYFAETQVIGFVSDAWNLHLMGGIHPSCPTGTEDEALRALRCLFLAMSLSLKPSSFFSLKADRHDAEALECMMYIASTLTAHL
jgi:hypothetical protein